jgi:hypothetical protein
MSFCRLEELSSSDKLRAVEEMISRLQLYEAASAANPYRKSGSQVCGCWHVLYNVGYTRHLCRWF